MAKTIFMEIQSIYYEATQVAFTAHSTRCKITPKRKKLETAINGFYSKKVSSKSNR